jgi:hypothetical protein
MPGETWVTHIQFFMLNAPALNCVQFHSLISEGCANFKNPLFSMGYKFYRIKNQEIAHHTGSTHLFSANKKTKTAQFWIMP